jgi:hypothetical protein
MYIIDLILKETSQDVIVTTYFHFLQKIFRSYYVLDEIT